MMRIMIMLIRMKMTRIVRLMLISTFSSRSGISSSASLLPMSALPPLIKIRLLMVQRDNYFRHQLIKYMNNVLFGQYTKHSIVWRIFDLKDTM